jgi:hypothetical protein
MCSDAAIDAHHIIERKLFDDSGYYLDNGVSLCSNHHILAEQTIISCDELRSRISATEIILPEHFEPEYRYDKWGNVILPNGNRLMGELFYDENVQKILKQANVLKFFSPYIKYPRTYHLPCSEKKTSDDKTLKNVNHFIGKEVVATIKMDGENTSLYPDYYHSRSIDGNSHPSRDMVKKIWSEIAWEIPTGFRLCGENMYALHTIPYKNLESYFLLFSIWDDLNYCLSWDDTVEYAKMLKLSTVPVLYRGIFDDKLIRSLYKPEYNGNPCEGYVVRLAETFKYTDFRRSVAKFVSGNFQISTGHWSKNNVIRNELINISGNLHESIFEKRSK